MPTVIYACASQAKIEAVIQKTRLDTSCTIIFATTFDEVAAMVNAANDAVKAVVICDDTLEDRSGAVLATLDAMNFNDDNDIATVVVDIDATIDVDPAQLVQAVSQLAENGTGVVFMNFLRILALNLNML